MRPSPLPFTEGMTDIERADALERHHASEAIRWRRHRKSLEHFEECVEPRLEAAKVVQQADRVPAKWRDDRVEVGAKINK